MSSIAEHDDGVFLWRPSVGQLWFSTGTPIRHLKAGSLVAFSFASPLIKVAMRESPHAW
jgi:hypothetical protein